MHLSLVLLADLTHAVRHRQKDLVQQYAISDGFLRQLQSGVLGLRDVRQNLRLLHSARFSDRAVWRQVAFELCAAGRRHYVNSMDGRDLANLLECFARVKVNHKPLTRQVSERLRSDTVSRLSPDCRARIVCALVRLQSHSVDSSDPELLQFLLLRINETRALEHLKGFELSNVAFSLAKAKTRHLPTFQAIRLQFSKTPSRSPGGGEPREGDGVPFPSPSLSVPFVPSLSFRELEGADLVRLLYAFTKVRIQDASFLLAVLQRLFESNPDLPLSHPLRERQQQQHTAASSPAFEKEGEAGLERSNSFLDDLKTGHVVSLCMSLARLRWLSPLLIDPYTRTILSKAAEALPVLGGRDLIMLIGALRRLADFGCSDTDLSLRVLRLCKAKCESESISLDALASVLVAAEGLVDAQVKAETEEDRETVRKMIGVRRRFREDLAGRAATMTDSLSDKNVAALLRLSASPSFFVNSKRKNSAAANSPLLALFHALTLEVAARGPKRTQTPLFLHALAACEERARLLQHRSPWLSDRDTDRDRDGPRVERGRELQSAHSKLSTRESSHSREGEGEGNEVEVHGETEIFVQLVEDRLLRITDKHLKRVRKSTQSVDPVWNASGLAFFISHLAQKERLDLQAFCLLSSPLARALPDLSPPQIASVLWGLLMSHEVVLSAEGLFWLRALFKHMLLKCVDADRGRDRHSGKTYHTSEGTDGSEESDSDIESGDEGDGMNLNLESNSGRSHGALKGHQRSLPTHVSFSWNLGGEGEEGGDLGEVPGLNERIEEDRKRQNLFFDLDGRGHIRGGGGSIRNVGEEGKENIGHVSTQSSPSLQKCASASLSPFFFSSSPQKVALALFLLLRPSEVGDRWAFVEDLVSDGLSAHSDTLTEFVPGREGVVEKEQWVEIDENEKGEDEEKGQEERRETAEKELFDVIPVERFAAALESRGITCTERRRLSVCIPDSPSLGGREGWVSEAVGLIGEAESEMVVRSKNGKAVGNETRDRRKDAGLEDSQTAVREVCEATLRALYALSGRQLGRHRRLPVSSPGGESTEGPKRVGVSASAFPSFALRDETAVRAPSDENQTKPSLFPLHASGGGSQTDSASESIESASHPNPTRAEATTSSLSESSAQVRTDRSRGPHRTRAALKGRLQSVRPGIGPQKGGGVRREEESKLETADSSAQSDPFMSPVIVPVPQIATVPPSLTGSSFAGRDLDTQKQRQRQLIAEIRAQEVSKPQSFSFEKLVQVDWSVSIGPFKAPIVIREQN
uniref:Uncharacterized protein n=1 Tax=Chromera velia CCMP2878 TaxID=1169474 RepID=A0A0G4I1G9_9ALVE|eukprot:Cvel_10157.t1-p1 / transcript=Cvel_10157.t1 / gene=Cvel_10157 / organism=Chromera_velia_CCMP2878 / gene_product=hypothetical protein / transcript_product=hypothetical protein / location=Cvel_scaffold606:13854-19880(-) / protein_length=1263 / sequence_SO=supercontig / SO=protein_coding / is_pseudo=false